MSESGDSSVESESVGENVLDVVSFDGLEVSVESSLSDDNNGLSLSDLSVLLEQGRQGTGSALRRRSLGGFMRPNDLHP